MALSHPNKLDTNNFMRETQFTGEKCSICGWQPVESDQYLLGRNKSVHVGDCFQYNAQYLQHTRVYVSVSSVSWWITREECTREYRTATKPQPDRIL